MRAFRDADVGDDAIAARGDREGRENPVRVEIDRQFRVRDREPGNVEVRQNPVALQSVAFEPEAQAMANHGVRAVAADQPFGLDFFLRAVGPPQDRRHAGLRLREADRLDLPLDSHAQFRQMLVEQPLGLRLRQHQREGIRARDAGKADVADRLVACDHIGGRDLVSRRDKRGAATRAVEQFQRPAPEHQSLGFVGSLRGLVDDADRYAIARQFRRHRQADRAGADDQNFRDHWPSPQRAKPNLKKRQPACKPGSVWPEALASDATTIPLGRPSPGASSNQPERPGQQTGPASPRGGARRSYSVLLPAGLAVPPTLPPARCALAAPFHPYRPAALFEL